MTTTRTTIDMILQLHPAKHCVICQEAKSIDRHTLSGHSPEQSLLWEALTRYFQLLTLIEVENAVGAKLADCRVELKQEEFQAWQL